MKYSSRNIHRDKVKWESNIVIRCRERKRPEYNYMGFAASCVGSRPKRFLIVTLCLENLSSGEKRAEEHV